MTNLAHKKRKRMVLYFLRYTVYCIYIYISIYICRYLYISIYIFIYIYISIYIYIYILKKRTWVGHAFFYVLCKRMLHSLRSFTFFAKVRCILCVLYVLKKELKRMHRSFGFHKSPKTRKRKQNIVACFKRTIRSERKRMRCPTLELITD